MGKKPVSDLAAAQRENAERIASFGTLAVKAHYDAGKRGRRLASWNPSSAGPNVALATLQTIRNRARHANNNEWSAASSSRTVVTDVVGTGITARPKTKSINLKQKLIKLWDKFTNECDADGVLTFYGQQALIAETWENAGEVFVRLRPRRMNDGLSVPLQIQLLEPEMVPQLDRDLPNGNKIRQGIEFDKIGRRVAYWMYSAHPGDYQSTAQMQDIKPVPADQVLHIYKPGRIGQLRGVPSGTSSMVRTKIVGDYDDAVTEKAKLQNLFTAVITRPTPVAGQENIDPLTGQIINQSDNDMPMVSMEPGATIELAPGEDVKWSNQPATGVGYNDYMRQQYLGITAGRGVPYELATGDITNVSDRTLRVVVQQYRRNIEQKQWLYLIPQFCQKVRDAWVDAAVLAGEIALADAEDAKNVEWSPQAWQYIHPVQDVQSKVAEINAGIVSRDQVISSRGYDPEEVDAQRAEAKKREERLGLSIVPEPQPTAAQSAADKKVEADQKAKKAQAEVDLLVAQADSAKKLADAEDRRADTYAKSQEAHEAWARAEAEYVAVKSRYSEAEAALADARMDQIKAELDVSEANAEHTRGMVEMESAARIAESAARAEAAELESLERTIALRSAEAHAKEQRELVLDAERTRTAAARLELEAAQLGLAELKGEWA